MRKISVLLVIIFDCECRPVLRNEHLFCFVCKRYKCGRGQTMQQLVENPCCKCYDNPNCRCRPLNKKPHGILLP